MTSPATVWLDEARSFFQNGREQITTLSADPGVAASLTFTHELPSALAMGTILSVETEVMYVLSGTTTSATVMRGHMGSTAVAHAIGTVVRVNPVVTDFRLLQALNHELRSLSSPSNGLYRIDEVDLDVSAARHGYDLEGYAESQVLGLQTVLQQSTTGDYWTRLNGVRLTPMPGNADFPSGYGVFLTGMPSFPSDIRLVLKTGFSTLADGTTTLESTGLPETAWDIPPMGAAVRLAGPNEVRRSQIDIQPGSRRGDEVPPGAIFNSTRSLMMLHQSRIAEEANRLRARYPEYL